MHHQFNNIDIRSIRLRLKMRERERQKKTQIESHFYFINAWQLFSFFFIDIKNICGFRVETEEKQLFFNKKMPKRKKKYSIET